MAVEGSLDLFSLPEILQMISQQGKTGILTIQGQQDIVAISFLAGDIVAADSLAHTVEEGLAKLLVSEGLLSPAELARAVAEHQASGGRLLDLLVERRYLTRSRLLGALRLQTIRQLEALLRWQEGDFKFYGGDEVSYEEGFEPISVEDLLLRNLASFAGPPPAAQPLPPAGAAAGSAAGAAATSVVGAGLRPLPGTRATGGAAGERRSAMPVKPDSGELWLPQVPELPEVSMAAPPRETTPRAAAQLRSPVPAAAPVPPPGGGLAGAAVLPLTPAGAAAPDRARRAQPAAVPAAPPPPAAGTAPTVSASAAPAAPMADLAAGARSEPLPWPAAVLSPPASSPPVSGPVPWPAAALSHPPSSAPASPRAPAAGVLKPLGLPVAAGPVIAPAATGRAGTLWSDPAVAPDASFGGSPASASAAGRSAVLPAVAGRRQPLTVAGQGQPGQGPRVTTPGAPSPEGSLPKRFRQMQIERPDRLVPLAHRAAAAGLAVVVAIALVAAARRAPERVLLPFPWEHGERSAFERNQRESLYDKIEAAAKTAFLRDGRFPDQLGQLRDSGLLSPADLADPDSEPLLYSAREDSYTLQATEAGKPLADADTIGSISGNFLLDPTVLQSTPQTGPPIVLLD